MRARAKRGSKKSFGQQKKLYISLASGGREKKSGIERERERERDIETAGNKIFCARKKGRQEREREREIPPQRPQPKWQVALAEPLRAALTAALPALSRLAPPAPRACATTPRPWGVRGLDSPVESKTQTYHGRVGSGRTVGRRGVVGQDWKPTELFA